MSETQMQLFQPLPEKKVEPKKKYPKKVEVVISNYNYDGKRCKYVDSVKDGAEYTSVDYSGNIYGGASPCDNEEEIQSAVAHAVKRIKDEGDIPIVVDKRKEEKTLTINEVMSSNI